MPRVFLSHSRRDADLAAGIERALRKLGVEAFDVLERVTPGEDWRQSIKEAIRRADGFVLVVGAPESTSASRAGYELGIAEALAKPVLVLLSHNRSVGSCSSS